MDNKNDDSKVYFITNLLLLYKKIALKKRWAIGEISKFGPHI